MDFRDQPTVRKRHTTSCSYSSSSSSSTGSKRSYRRQSLHHMQTSPRVCTKYCRYKTHLCGRIHPVNIQCPPCRNVVTVKKPCGHECDYECHADLKWTVSSPCSNCADMADQQKHNLLLQSFMPPSSEQFTQQQQQPPQPTQNFGPAGIPLAVDRDKIYQWILELSNSVTRENALLELSKKREVVLDLAGMLWYSFGTMASLLQEIVSIYPYINPATLTAQQSNRVCNALALLQCVASHAETRTMFLQAHIPLFLYPFLHTTSKTRPFEYLRLTSLGVIGALVKNDEVEVINFLLTTEIIPLCLRIMETGNELSKTVATFILQKILLDDAGLNYICQTYDRFSHVAMILGKMVLSLAKDPSARLLKHVVRCYLRLSDNSRAREALRQCLPDQLKDSTFSKCLKDDKSTKHWLSQLLKNVEASPPSSVQSNGPDLSRSTPIS